MKLINLLTEYNFKVSKDNTYTWEYVGGANSEYVFNIDNDPEKTQYKVLFEKQDAGLYERMYMPITGKKPGSVFQMTGENKAFKINATVMDITLDFLGKNQDWHTVMIVPINTKRYNLVKLFLDANINKKKYFVDEEDGVFIILRKPS